MKAANQNERNRDGDKKNKTEEIKLNKKREKRE